MLLSQDKIRRFEARRQAELQASRQLQQPQAQKSGGFELSSLIQEGGAIGGAAAGAAAGSIVPGVGTLIGAGLGGFLGSLGGGLTESKVRDNKYDLGGNLKEASLDAVLSAGPLKLGKAAFAARGASKAGLGAGASIRQGLKEGSEFTLRGALGRGAVSKGDDLAIRPLGLNKSQKTAIRTAAGGDKSASEALSKFGVSSIDDITNQIASKQTAFDEIVGGINRKFTRNEISKSFKDMYEPLLRGNLSQQQVGQSLKAEADELIKRIPTGGLSGTALNKERKAFQKFAKRFGDNPTLQDTNEAARAATSGLLRSSGEGLEEVGKDLNVLRTAKEMAQKNVEQGTGRSGLRASDLIVGGPGAVLGGPVGAIGAAGIARAAASPTAARAASKTLRGAGNKLIQDGVRASGPRGVATNAARNLTLSGALGAGASQLSPQSVNKSVNNTNIAQSNNPASMDNIIDDSIAQNQPESNLIDVQGIALQLIERGASVEEVQQVVEELSTINSIRDGSYFMPEEAEAEPLTGDAAKRSLTAQSGLRSLSTLEDALANNPSAFQLQALPNPLGITGRLTNTSEIRAANDNLVDVIARLRSGAAITDAEAKRFARLLPNPSDTVEAAATKLAAIKAELATFVEGTANPEAAAQSFNLGGL